MTILENIDIDKATLENIDIDIGKDILENIDIDKGILQNIYHPVFFQSGSEMAVQLFCSRLLVVNRAHQFLTCA